MSRVGITGHQRLQEELAWPWVTEQLRAELSTCRPLLGLSALAAGSDQRFANVVLDLGGRLEVILPFRGYRDLLSALDQEQFDLLLKQAARVRFVSEHPGAEFSKEEAYMAAGRAIVDASDILFAVWERGREGSIGSTGSVVDYAVQQQRPLIVFDPRARHVDKTGARNWR